MKMKIAIAMIFITGLLVCALKAQEAPTYSNLYPASMIVVEVNQDTDMVTLQDFNGFLWQFEGVEDWVVNDICACIMNDMNTESIFDDEIVETRYCGWVQ